MSKGKKRGITGSLNFKFVLLCPFFAFVPVGSFRSYYSKRNSSNIQIKISITLEITQNWLRFHLCNQKKIMPKIPKLHLHFVNEQKRKQSFQIYMCVKKTKYLCLQPQ